MPETDEQRITRLELDPRVVRELQDVRSRVRDVEARLDILELEVENYVHEDSQND
jgi:hypothetical protein